MEPDDDLGEFMFGDDWPFIKGLFPNRADDPQGLYEMLSYGVDDSEVLELPIDPVPGQLSLF